MRIQDIKIGEIYRFKEHPNYSYAKAIEILRPKHGKNTKSYSIVKCEHTVYRNDKMGFIRYFRPADLIREDM